MAICSKCGAEVANDASFCGKCGQPMGAAAVKMESTAAVPGVTPMAENVAGLLCYALGWITGLIFFFIDKRPFVRFHAAQSIVVFGGLQIIYIVLERFLFASFGFGAFGFFSVAGVLLGAIELVAFVLWIVLMMRAYQGQRFRVPVAADLAERLLGN